MKITEKIIKVSTEDTNNVQTLDLKQQALENTIVSFVEMHALDETPAVQESPMMQRYEARYEDALMAFDTAKSAIADKYIDDELQKICSKWSLEYNTCELKCEFSEGFKNDDAAIKDVVITVSEEDAKKVHKLDIKQQALQNIVASFAEMHALDSTCAAQESPMMQRYEERYAEALTAFDTAKSELADKYISKDMQEVVAKWSLEYDSCELKCKVPADYEYKAE